MKTYLALALPVIALSLNVACKTSGSDTSGDSGVDTTDTTGGGFDPNNDISLDWQPGEGDSGSSMTATVSNTDSTGFYLGFAETAANDAGWYGEDCAPNGCHHFSSMSGVLDYVSAPGDVDNDHTLFNNGSDGTGDVFTSSHEDRLTYLLQLEGGSLDGECYVWGDDPTYYDAEGCTVVGQ